MSWEDGYSSDYYMSYDSKDNDDYDDSDEQYDNEKYEEVFGND